MPVTIPRRWPVVAVAVTLALAGCRDPGGRSEPAPATTAAPATSTTVTAAQTTATSVRPPDRLTAEARLRMDGIGPVRIGMTVEQASAAAGVPIRVDNAPPFGPACQPASVPGMRDLGFIVIDGRIARVHVYEPSSIRTVSGVGVGTTEAEVHRVYGSRVTVERHVYHPTGHYLVYTAADPSLQHLRLLFETDGRVVTAFRAGLQRAVDLVEGCV